MTFASCAIVAAFMRAHAPSAIDLAQEAKPISEVE